MWPSLLLTFIIMAIYPANVDDLTSQLIHSSILVTCSSVLLTHKVHTYIEYHSVCPLVRFGTPPPLSLKRVSPSLQNQKGGDTRLWVRGWGSPNSDDWRKA